MTAPATKPLPCPFCGREPSTGGRSSDHTPTRWWCWIVCYCGGYSATAYKAASTEAEALALWNTRASVDDAATVARAAGEVKP